MPERDGGATRVLVEDDREGVEHTGPEWETLIGQVTVVYLALGVLVLAATVNEWVGFASEILTPSAGLVAVPLLASAVAQAGVQALADQTAWRPTHSQKGRVSGFVVVLLSGLTIWKPTRPLAVGLSVLVLAAGAWYVASTVRHRSRLLTVVFVLGGLSFAIVVGFALATTLPP